MYACSGGNIDIVKHVLEHKKKLDINYQTKVSIQRLLSTLSPYCRVYE